MKHGSSFRTLARALLGASTLALLLGGMSAAQAQAQDAVDAAGDIVVTARKVEERLQDVPVAITAFTGDQLQSKNATLVSDVALLTPGFTVRQAPGNATAATLSLRGQAQNEILATLEPSVATYVDEMYWARAYGLNSSMLDVANVQVLKGPQGTLFGRNSTGGAFLLTTANPDFDRFAVKASATYGRFNEATFETAVNIPVDDKLALRVAFRTGQRDGWAYGVRQYDPTTGLPANQFLPNGDIRSTSARFNDRDEMQGRAKALVKFSDTTSLLLSGEWYKAKMQGTARQLIYKVNLNQANDNVAARSAALAYQAYMAGHPNAVGYDAFDCGFAVTQPATNCQDSIRPYSGIDLHLHTGTYVAKLQSDITDAMQLKVIAGYRQVVSNNLFDIDGSSTLIHSSTLYQNLKQWSAEAQVTGQLFDNAVEYAAGATYFTESGNDQGFSFSSGPGGDRLARSTRNFGDLDNKSWGVFGQFNYHITSKLTFTGGLRYSQDQKGLEIRSANVNLAGVPTGIAPGAYVPGTLTDPCNAAGVGTITGATPTNDCSAFRSDSFSAVSWTAGFDYKATSDLLFYAKASRGYRSGGQNLRAFNDAQFQPFQPEILNEQEIGMKADFRALRTRLNIAAYHNVLTDAQRDIIRTAGILNVNLVDNAGKIRNLGVEADLIISPFRGLKLSASGSINDAKILEFDDDLGDRSDQRLPLIAKYQNLVSAEYATHLNDAISVVAGVDYSWSGKIAGDACVLTGLSACYAGGPDVTGRTAQQISQDIVNATTQASAGILGARVTFGFNDDQYKLAFWGRNLANDRGFVQQGRLIAPQRNYVGGIRREPLTYGLTGSVSF